MGGLKLIPIYTHYVTPTYSKYNLLGMLHVASRFRTAIIRRVRVHGYTYTVELLTDKSERELAQDLAETVQRERREIVRAEGKRYRAMDGFGFVCQSSGTDPYFNAPAVCRYIEYLTGKETSLSTVSKSGKGRKSTQASESEVFSSIFAERIHDKRSSTGKSPSLILAPELGKYATSGIPYEGGLYPDVGDSGGASACLLFALIGWACCSFKWEIAEERRSHHVFAYVAPKDYLGHAEAKALYWIGRRLAYVTSLFVSYAGREASEVKEKLSTLGILAMLSPVIRDVAESADILSKLELNIYTHSFEGGRHSIRIAGAFGLDRVDVRLLPSRLVGAMLAYVNHLPKLVFEVPSFLNTLGEYLVSGNDVLYIEALRELASVLSDRETSEDTKWMARVLLQNAGR
ncbi:hypothetical protein Igag_0918 [Ignisphaera aggregans DSM 17230]|uniref:Uncharacterized protein n=1 Tax=Ignisphaera aggregans (strain DSM 17230 / JCM 13409 / AQ1.S1) TaxID=583356 RepID=E0STW8_IGNAA|nr:hypothetical protein Igag_0918 [Ignisphaera aggregans DSM 17230]